MTEAISGSMRRERNGTWAAYCDFPGCSASATNLHDTGEGMDWLRLHWRLWRDRPDLHALVATETVVRDA